MPPFVPDALKCPISSELMTDPVSTADGFSYEREAITKWLHDHRTSPLTGAQLEHTELIPNLALRSTIQELVAQQPELKQLLYVPAARGTTPTLKASASASTPPLTHAASDDYLSRDTLLSVERVSLTRRPRGSSTSISSRRAVAERLEVEAAEALQLEQSRSRRAALEASLREHSAARRQQDAEREEEELLWAVFQSDLDDLLRRTAPPAASAAASPAAPAARPSLSGSMRERLRQWLHRRPSSARSRPGQPARASSGGRGRDLACPRERSRSAAPPVQRAASAGPASCHGSASARASHQAPSRGQGATAAVGGLARRTDSAGSQAHTAPNVDRSCSDSSSAARDWNMAVTLDDDSDDDSLPWPTFPAASTSQSSRPRATSSSVRSFTRPNGLTTPTGHSAVCEACFSRNWVIKWEKRQTSTDYHRCKDCGFEW
ncbi:hypothetical protein AB1Y20_009554 [Prymnesium parvum]|uniref:U-box domain-containing protein n=1 Tax=Prymnesium parvum TaxID=97485 RepID=A0AB34K1X8_PRYPA